MKHFINAIPPRKTTTRLRKTTGITLTIAGAGLLLGEIAHVGMLMV